jgi:hypothetical protein
MPSVDCRQCGETTFYDLEKDMEDIQPVKAPDGEQIVVFTVRCGRCGAKVPAGGRDGKGNV